MKARVYGIGVGPGAPDLLTLRARTLIHEVDVLVCPRSSPYGESLAYSIAKVHVRERKHGDTPLFLHFPMSKDPQIVREAIRQAVATIAAAAQPDKTIGFLTEGDPSTYSSFIYVRRALQAEHPEIEVEVVPGVSSIMAVPAVSGLDLADGHERIAILPATYGVDDLAQVIAHFDTIVLMKVGAEWPHIVKVVRELGLLDHAVFVNKATMLEQRILRNIEALHLHRGDCQSMIVIRKPGRAGLLVGQSLLPATAQQSCEENLHVR